VEWSSWVSKKVLRSSWDISCLKETRRNLKSDHFICSFDPDIAYLVISRFILLDSMLLFFTVLSIYCLACFRATEDKPGPFTFEWWYWMTMTGLSLGCVVSVKWVGLFAIAVVGLYTVEDLWRLLGDKTISMVGLNRSFASFGLANDSSTNRKPMSSTGSRGSSA